MIKNLTDRQWSQIPVYLKKWLDAGYRTKTMDREKATAAIYFLSDLKFINNHL